MKKILALLFIGLLNFTNHAFSDEKILKYLKEGKKLIFIRHAIAPGNGDPDNFNIKDCSTQRNLSERGRKQAKKIGNFFKKNKIPIDIVFSSEWCRCKETASIAFNNFQTKKFLNSFYSPKYEENRELQMINLKKFIDNWNSDKNLVLVTHYVLISEVINYTPNSGEIIIADKNFTRTGSIEIDY